MDEPQINNNNITYFDVSEETNRCESDGKVKTSRVFFTTMAANLSSFAVGTTMSWPSPVTVKMKSIDISDSPFNYTIGKEEDAWISSIIGIGASLTPFIAGPLADKIGRKKVLLSSSVFFIVAYILMLTAHDIWFLLLGRLIKGFGIGFVMSIVPMYVGEISTDNVRGAAGSLMSLFMGCGIYYVYCIGPFVSYQTLQYCCLVIPFIFDLVFMFMPESPYFYLANGRRQEATSALQFLRGQSAAEVQKELLYIESMVKSSMAKKGTFLDIVKNAGNRKALFICLGLITLQQVSGINAVLFNSQSIFESANIGFEAAFGSIAVGTVQVLSSALTPFIADKLPRKTILLISAVFMGVGLATLGCFFYIKIVIGDATGYNWIPVPALILYIIMFTAGYGPLPWTVLSEMFPPNVKPIAASLGASTCWSVGFFVGLFYPTLEAFGVYYAFWFFAICCAGASFFTLFVVMETKGLSLQEIQNRLNDRTS